MTTLYSMWLIRRLLWESAGFSLVLGLKFLLKKKYEFAHCAAPRGTSVGSFQMLKGLQNFSSSGRNGTLLDALGDFEIYLAGAVSLLKGDNCQKKISSRSIDHDIQHFRLQGRIPG